MSTSELSIFQCLICDSFLDNLLKVEKHIEKHKDYDDNYNNANQANGVEASSSSSTEPQVRRRGMLPIKKVTFPHLTIDLDRGEIGAFLNKYNDDDVGPPELDYYGPPRDDVVSNTVSLQSKVTPESGRLHRRSRLKADAKLRQVTAILRIPDQAGFQRNDETEAEMDFIRNLEVDDDDEESYHDGDYVPSKTSKTSTKSKPKTQYKKRINRAAAVLTKRVGRPLKHFGGGRGGGGQSSQKSFTTTTSSIEKVPIGRIERRCKCCDQTFATQYELSQHVLESHPEECNSLSCPVPTCVRNFQCRSSLASHINVHNNAERHEILVRNDPSSTATSLLSQNSGGSLKRIERLLATSSFRCKFCVQKCETMDELKQHLRLEHADVTILKCPECTKTFDNDCNDVIMTLIVHVRTSHPERLDPFNEKEREKDATKKFKCSKCGNHFRTSNGLKKHMKVHKPKIQEDEQSTLNEQLKLNTASIPDPKSSPALGPEPFHCPVCKKGFRYKDNLRRHFTLHLENNPFVCKFPGCGAKFNSDYNLRRHGAIHMGVKRIRLHCPICPSTVWSKDKLILHLRDRHKPSDMKKGVNQEELAKYRAAKRYTYRPYRPKYETLQTLQTKSSPSSSTLTPKIVKMEQSAANINEIHLVDKIVIQDDGNVVHVKGETLSPEKTQPQPKSPPSSKSTSSSPSPSKCKIFIPKTVKLGEPVTSIIARDPVFQKLAEQDASVREMLNSKVYWGSGKVFSCRICPQTFTRAWTLQLHLQTIHKSSILEQEQKQKELNREQNLQKQKGGGGATPGIVTLMCGRCAYTAKNAADLEKHMKTAPFHGDHGPTCEKCQETFKNQSQLQAHLDTVHNVQSRPFVCQFCRKSFTTELFLKNHEARIHNSRKVTPMNVNSKRGTSECPICHKMLSHTSLNDHINRHDTEAFSKVKVTNFQCKLCHDSFANIRSLQRHVDCVHLGKPLNKGQRQKKLLGSASATTSASSLDRDPLELSSPSSNEPVRRGPKPKQKPEGEWYMPLVEQALLPVDGTFENNRCRINDGVESNEVASGKDNSPSSQQETAQSQVMNVDNDDMDGGEMSILGF